MKFSTRQDIEAPAEFVFERFADFEGLERQAMRRGIDVKRKSPSQPRGVGAGWTLKVPFRGKLRDLAVEISYPDVDALIQHGAAALEEMKQLEILTGTRLPAEGATQ